MSAVGKILQVDYSQSGAAFRNCVTIMSQCLNILPQAAAAGYCIDYLKGSSIDYYDPGINSHYGVLLAVWSNVSPAVAAVICSELVSPQAIQNIGLFGSGLALSYDIRFIISCVKILNVITGRGGKRRSKSN